MANGDTLPDLVASILPQLIKQFDTSTLSELDLRLGELRITLRRALRNDGAPLPPPPPLVQQSGAEEAAPVSEGHTITAQMVGTFYISPGPGKPSFVQEGDYVEAGQVVGIIEAMKVMNEIETEVAGRVSHVLVKNQTPVEYGQPLMIIIPE
ncbi:MAG: acetyl-CoA carboxylase, biotin carboxyl carrier protein [Chloroflexi bacterium]|nr:acetyl-CoA carboxylase, biotin carboxyl carrier protein [Chloroflexota bacterium]MCL5947301.1 acetyl-CoA carboxylase, biotin carboxyl carrier protein [Chloroflexota bacterium]